ncbi:MAG: Fur family transcriptional regulator [Atribacterota bacterium]
MPVAQNARELKELLRSRGVRPSYIRLRVFQYLLGTDRHPSAEEIYQGLLQDIPTLSRASVYNALAALVAAQLVRVLTIEKNEMRYDAALREHGHFQCEVCGQVFDFRVTSFQWDGLEGFLVKSKDVYFRGICPQCRKGGEEHGKSRENATSWGTFPFDGGQNNSRNEEAPR